MKKILLSKNKYAIVDDDQYTFLMQWKWSCDRRGYAMRSQKTDEIVDGKRRVIFMHRVLLNAPTGLEVDHKNGDPLDNRLSNLRLCNKSQNMRNRKVAKNNISGYKGVWFNKKRNKWIAYIKLDQARVLAHTKTAEEAAYIYDQVSIQLWGEYARTNIL